MKSRGIGALVLFLLTTWSHADSLEEALARCAGIDRDDRRLACYDALVHEVARDRPPVAEPGWQLHDPGDGSSVELTLAADRDASGEEGRIRPVLVLRCRGGVFEAFVRTGMIPQEAHEPGVATILRLDDEPAFTERMTSMEEGKALAFSSPLMVASQLLRHETLYFQFLPRHSRPASVEFHARGLDRAMAPVLDACGLVLAADGILEPR